MIEAARKLIMGLALAGYTSCSSGGGTPPPQPPPPPPDPSPICEPGATCGCWHRPPGEDWQQLPPCTTPSPTDCNPALDPALSAPAGADSEWPKAADQSLAGPWKQAVWNGVRAAQAVCPSAWSGDCLAGGPQYIDAGYRLIAKQLQLAGIAASQAEVDGQRRDHLWIIRAPGSKDWNGSKLFHYGNGCLITADSAFTVHGWYTYTGTAPTPTPTPAPTPTPGGCSAPLPPKVWTAETLPDGWGSNEIGQPRWEIGCVAHGRVVDCTPRVAPRACGYCDAIGMGSYADGQPRCGCPVRNECLPPEQTPPQNFKCEERVACEQYLTGGTRLEARNGATCEFARGNPLQFVPNDGNCRICAVGDPRVCGGWF